MQVRIEVWPPGWLITSLPNFDPAGQDSAPGAPGGPVAPCGPVATLIVVVTAGACCPTPKAVAASTPEPAAASSAPAATICGKRLLMVLANLDSLLERVDPAVALPLRLAAGAPQRPGGAEHGPDPGHERQDRLPAHSL